MHQPRSTTLAAAAVLMAVAAPGFRPPLAARRSIFPAGPWGSSARRGKHKAGTKAQQRAKDKAARMACRLNRSR